MKEQYLEYMLPAAFIIFVFGMIGLIMWHNKKRREAIMNVAAGKGWKYERKATIDTNQTIGIIGIGINKTQSNIISGSLSAEADGMIYDLTTTRNSVGNKGSRTETSTYTYFQINFKSLTLPEFNLAKEGFFGKLVDRIGFADIDFPESPEFSDNFRLMGKNETAIREVFNSNIIHYFVTHPGWSIECKEGVLLGTKHKKLKAEEWPGIIEAMREMASVFTRK